MKTLIVSLTVLFLRASAICAAEDTVPSAEARLAAIQRNHQVAEQAYNAATEISEQGADPWKAFDAAQAELFSQAVSLARENPRSQVGLAALEFVLTKPRSYYLEAGRPAMELVAEQYAADPGVGLIVSWVGYKTRFMRENNDAYTAVKALIESVAAQNADRVAHGQALIALAWSAKQRFEVAEY